MERRRASRRYPGPDEPISRLRLRMGRAVTVIDLSDDGALVESHTRLLPGTHVDVHVITRDGRILVRSRVTRCFISTLRADAVCYRGALAFGRLVDTAPSGYAVPDEARSATRIAGVLYPPLVGGDAVRGEQGPSA